MSARIVGGHHVESGDHQWTRELGSVAGSFACPTDVAGRIANSGRYVGRRIPTRLAVGIGSQRGRFYARPEHVDCRAIWGLALDIRVRNFRDRRIPGELSSQHDQSNTLATAAWWSRRRETIGRSANHADSTRRFRTP